MTDFSLYLVTDPVLGGGPEKVAGIVDSAISGGVSVVQLRDKNSGVEDVRAAAKELKELCDARGVALVVNDYLDIAVELGLHLHIGQGDTPYTQARELLPAHLELGLSIENLDQLHAVIAQCAETGVALPDVIGIGPVASTATKPDAAPALGVEGIAEIAAVAQDHGIASVAIGGVGLRNAAELAATPIDGLCVVSEIMTAANPAAAATRLRTAFQPTFSPETQTELSQTELQGAFVNSPSAPRVLSIAGTDPTGGAGIQADLKSIAAGGGYGMCIVTSLVAQNTHGVNTIHTPPLTFLEEQLEAVFSDVTVDAIKLGMLGSADTVDLVASWLGSHEHGPVVLDPVMIATSGDRLLDASAEESLRRLAVHVDVVTPNIPELAVLCDSAPAITMDEAIAQAQEFARTHDTIVIVKGGHLTGALADNAVVRPDGSVFQVENLRVNTTNSHGTGCSLSASLATRIAAGESVEKALEWSTRWLNEALRHADHLAVGTGNGPVDHGHLAQRMTHAAETTPWAHLRAPRLDGATAASFTTPSTVKSPAPRIEPAGPFTRALWEASGDIIAGINSSDFITMLGDGTLRRPEFDFYIDQDAQYLAQYSRALARLSSIAPDSHAQIEWAQSAAECLVVEAELHRSYMAGKEVSAPSHITMAYTDFLIARTYTEDYVCGVAAVLPCYWLYAEIGLMLAEQNHDEHPYKDWLNTYSGEEFIAGTRAAIARLEKALENAGAEQRVDAARAFLSASVHEREFFDQATRHGWTMVGSS
ncbi:bifunctional hydroxymethylpyrimidine kinase/phosphomethylpyrimidine kinase [Corynebacterium glutamicum]|uniref:bifunctional hydroxymethylpyrimidine kinase/phosphomethylpyrimidine kinase n=1 Tax=Corynebacterium glutamicum TaxID=1718 RepID=UPI0009427735|nr:bifunctional hydroxymethylpyrimidine kinase/phosphomethylpyrimidine kinase [Corynebacterium glutamicum]OKX85654.1 hydroxymethylpyrimidine/phosphomethylpyrimidine kinase [Corynebacterium glutamicum]QDX76944.1 hydroxymethylpyrimidine/phosphomethylpyrimidine kinase [Corynebacterium glutamicum]QDX79714.1 hydroxymethylpyrimidine/phosphomethylpyrimidine kinase [Corynebacterium glutamicum]